MAVKFAVRGSALTAYLHSGNGKTPIPYDINSGGVPAVVADAAAIGGQAINYNGGVSVRGHLFPGFDNSTKTGIISVLARIAPGYTGSPTLGNVNVICVAGPKITSVVAQLLQIDHLTNGNLVLTLMSPSGGTSQSNAVLGAWSPTAGQYYDIVVTWNGTTAANGIKVYIDGTLFAQATASVTWALGALHTCIGLGVGMNSVILGTYKLNEYVLWDSVIDPTSGGLNLNGSARASFVSLTGLTLDPTNSTDPGIHNVAIGVGYTINGVALTGDSDEPAPTDVRYGVQYDNNTKTGSLHVPTAAQVLSGVAVDAGTGTVELPDVADVLEGVDFGAGGTALTGTLPQVINTLTQASLVGEGLPPTVTGVTLTQGDALTLDLKALLGPALDAFDLTAASFETTMVGTSGNIVIPNGQHAADPDQTTNKGVFRLTLTTANTDALKLGTKKEIVTKVTQGSSVIYFHGKILNVVTKTPAA